MRLVLALIAIAGFATAAHAQEFRLEDVPSVTDLPIGKLKLGVIAFSDHRSDPLVDPSTGGLMKFADWTRARPLQKQLLSLYPSYEEPTLKSTSGGVSRIRKSRLHMYVAEARFLVDKPTIDLTRYATLPFIEKLDPAIASKLLPAADALPQKEPQFAYNRNPDRPWCASSPTTLCIASRYKFEGKLPIWDHAAQQAARQREEDRRLSSTFKASCACSPGRSRRSELQKLTGLDTPIVGVLEQNIFYVNQIMQFGKFIAVVQKHPTDAGQDGRDRVRDAGGRERRSWRKKKEYERVPVLRNLVPAQVLVRQQHVQHRQLDQRRAAELCAQPHQGDRANPGAG